jgi:hypothetical protein
MKSTYKKKRLLNIQKNVLLVGDSKYTLEKTEEAITNEQSRETGNIGNRRPRTKTNMKSTYKKKTVGKDTTKFNSTGWGS